MSVFCRMVNGRQESTCQARLPGVVEYLLRLSPAVSSRPQVSRLPASTRRKSSKQASVQCRLNGVSVCVCNERVQEGQCVYQTKGMRNQCRSVCGVCQSSGVA